MNKTFAFVNTGIVLHNPGQTGVYPKLFFSIQRYCLTLLTPLIFFLYIVSYIKLYCILSSVDPFPPSFFIYSASRTTV